MHEKAVIDVHAHILPAIYVEAMREAGLQDAAGNPVGDGFPFPKWTLDDSLDVMDRFDIAASILSITAPGIQFCPAEKTRALAGERAGSLEDIVTRAAADPAQKALFNNAAQAWNHAFYWRGGAAPRGAGAPAG